MEPIRINPHTDRLTDLSVKMLQSVADQPNVLISPISALAALAMAQHGAAGDTRSQIDAVLGSDVKEIVSVFTKVRNLTPPRKERSLLSRIYDPPAPKAAEVNFANLIWIPERPEVQTLDSYQQKIIPYTLWNFPMVSQRDIDEAVFMVDYLSRWRTNGKISRIINNVSDLLTLCLPSGAAFTSEWDEGYVPNDVYPETFTTESGVKARTDFLHSIEPDYIEDEFARGFIKAYSDNRYAFAALVPKKIPLKDYISTLSSGRLQDTLLCIRGTNVRTAMPKFTRRRVIDLREIFMNWGITDAFDPHRADFSEMVSCTEPKYNLYIGAFTQENYLELKEEGGEPVPSSWEYIDDDCYTDDNCYGEDLPDEFVRLDRPFLYMIMDWSVRLPILIGTVTDLEGMLGE